MPETAKHDAREESPNGTKDAAAGVREEAGLSPDTAAAEAEVKAGPAVVPAEPAPLAAPGISDDRDIHALAQSVISSLEEARLKLHGDGQSEPHGDPGVPEGEPGFFAGWHGLLDEHSLEDGEDPLPAEEATLDREPPPGMAPPPGDETPLDEETLLEVETALDEETPLDDEMLLDEETPLDDEPPLDEALLDEEMPLDEEPLLGDESGEAAARPFEDLFEGRRSLSEIGLAARTAVGRDGEDLSSKHDELADAVQSALSSIYGEPSSGSASPASPASAFTSEIHARTAGWSAPGVAGSADDTLTPQEVILNYFDYDPNLPQGAAAETVNRAADFVRGGGGGGEDDYLDSEDFHSGRPQWPKTLAEAGLYDGPPSYPVPAGFVPPAREAAAERENSRLLGAAAIGLVGGIAIAASLAVFVINSYGPGVKTGPAAANRAFDAAEFGYGRRRGAEAPEPQKDANAAAAATEEPLAVAASDIVATPGQSSALAIAISPERSGEQALVSITGVPDGARLSAGVDAGGGNWLLPPHRLKGLAISVPPSAAEPFLLEVQLLDGNVRTPLSDKKQFAVRVSVAKPESASLVAVARPAAAAEAATLPEPPKPAQSVDAPVFSTQTLPAPAGDIPAAARAEPEGADAKFRTQTVPAPAAPRLASAAPASQQRGAPQTDIEDLIREGNKRMREGDILEARQLYQKAVALGDPEAALAMGRSFDPIYFARIDRKNAEPDAAKAFDWYRKAMDGGAVQTAKVRIENLKHFLNE